METPVAAPSGRKHLLERIAPWLGLALFTVALAVLGHELRAVHIGHVLGSLAEIPRLALVAALLLAALSYLLQTTYDLMAARYVGLRLPFRRVALASFVGVSLSNTVGHSLFTGASVRLRLYAGRAGGFDIARLNAFCTLTVWLGFLALAGVTLALEPRALAAALPLPVGVRTLGLAFLAAVALYQVVAWRGRAVVVRGLRLAPPGRGLAALQVVTAAADWALAGAVLYWLLPQPAPVSYLHLLGIYLLAQVGGLASQVPGGLGVFESLFLLQVKPFLAGDVAIAALVAYRVLYYLVPLAVAALLMAAHEIRERRAAFARASRAVGVVVAPLAPPLLAALTFAGGVVLLVSGSTPAVHGRLALLRDLLPLPVLEASHLLGSVTGAVLLFLAWGIYRRIDAAWALSVAGLAAGVVFSLVKGLDYEEAAVLVVFLVALVPSRRHFFRQASLLREPLSAGWVAAIVAVVLGTVWLGFFSYKHVEYSNQLWWHFAVAADAPRFLRASVAIVVVVLSFAVARLLRPARVRIRAPGLLPDDPVRGIVAASPNTYANLVLLGDKAVLHNQERTAFVMYAVRGRSWVAMGDPVGPEKDHAELVWRFRELSHRHGGRPVFYEVGKANLDLYLDLGLHVVKLGEEARVPLRGFTLEGSQRKDLRYIARRAERDGIEFEVVDRGGVPALLPELEAISDAWLEAKNTREKGFSLGFFSPAYLSEFPCAVVRQGGRVVAFANLWLGAGEELSVDLMRHEPGAYGGVMELLFVRLLLWGAEQGYAWFNLGMVPFKGMQGRSLAPLWHRVGAALFRHGERFYNFQGLHRFKEKFDPVWSPRFLASPGGLALPRVLADVASLVSRGLKGAVAK